MKTGDLVKLVSMEKIDAPDDLSALRPTNYITLWKERLRTSDEFTQTGEFSEAEVAIVLNVSTHDLSEEEAVVLLDNTFSREVEVLTASGQRGWTWEHFLEIAKK